MNSIRRIRRSAIRIDGDLYSSQLLTPFEGLDAEIIRHNPEALFVNVAGNLLSIPAAEKVREGSALDLLLRRRTPDHRPPKPDTRLLPGT